MGQKGWLVNWLVWFCGFFYCFSFTETCISVVETPLVFMHPSLEVFRYISFQMSSVFTVAGRNHRMAEVGRDLRNHLLQPPHQMKNAELLQQVQRRAIKMI